MGCGQSKVHLYPRKSKSKTNGKKSGHGELGADVDLEQGNIIETEKNACNASQKNENGFHMGDSKISDADCELSVSIIRAKNMSLLQNQDISRSQQNFFEMLDKKIEEGPDYDSNSETEIALEEARLNALVQHWETASVTASMCSSASHSLHSTPVHQIAAKTPQSQPVAVQCILPGNVATEALEVAGFITHNPTYRVPLTAEQAACEHQQQQQQQQQMMISHIMQQMTSVPQQTQINALSQRLQPSTLVGVGGGGAAAPIAACGQPLQILTNVGSSPAHAIEPRALTSSLPRAHQLGAMAMSSQMQSQNHYASPPAPSSSPSLQGFASGARSPRSDNINIMPSTQLNLPNQMVYYNQPTPIMHQITPQMTTQQNYPPPACFRDAGVHSIQVEPAPSTNTDYRFPAAISVQRLAPQVQRQLRETQEFMKDACPPPGYGSSGPPPVRSQIRNPSRRPTLESKFSQELS